MIAPPIAETPPDLDCPFCHGEGVNQDLYHLFDFEMVAACPRCWEGDDK